MIPAAGGKERKVKMYKIKYNDLIDKIHGCWYGKCLGGAGGALREGIKAVIDIDDFTEILDPNLPNDDLDIQLLWLDILESKGVSLTSKDLADAWIEKCWYPFSEYGYFIKNYERGINPPYSGIINNSFFKEGMGCPIRSEIWAVISPGHPELAVKYAYIDATLDHTENSVYAEQFLAAAESIAFFEDDIMTIAEKAMRYIPADSKLCRCFSDVIKSYKSGEDFLTARRTVLSKYSHPDFTNVTQNLGFILIALLYGNGDIRSTINIALRCGYDTDCTCASAASIVGIIKGYNGLGNEITSLIKDYFICGINVKRPSDSIRRLAEDCGRIAVSIENPYIEIIDAAETNKISPDIKCIPVTEAGMQEELSKINPVKWKVYGPFFEQLEQPIDSRYPSPHGGGSVLPDLVCMVNSQVFLDKKYIDETTLQIHENDFIGEIFAYEDLIPIEDVITMQGQMCIYLKTTVTSPKDQRIWGIIGNTDGFKLWVNKTEIMSKDEIRMYTPYNNFCFIDLKEGENEIVLKLLRRTDNVKFALGFRQYNGNHWHRSKWCTDLKY